MDQTLKPTGLGADELFTMMILRRRFDTVNRQMVQALFKTGRSGVLNTGMDFSTAICDAALNSIGVEIGIPIHIATIELIPKAVITQYGDDIRAGDCFANTSAFHGNTHCADFTLCAPGFVEGKLAFFTIARAHFADMGFPIPTTYAPLARDVYEEGLQLPCVRIQRDYEDVGDIIRICKANIRVPEQFYGDYLGTLSAVRTGERRLNELCQEVGYGKVQRFLDDWQTYAERIATEAIRKLPGGVVEKEAFYDSEDPRYVDGIPVRAKLTVDTEKGYITVDLTDNIDNLPLGINLSEATARAAALIGVFNMLNVIEPSVPRCSGSFKRVGVLLREGAAVGVPRHPASTSCATTNLCHVLGSLVQSMFGDLRSDLGIASASVGVPASMGVISGTDFRRNQQSYVNQLILGYFSGPALNGHDGWLTFGGTTGAGALQQASIEVVELQHPIIIEKLAIACGSGGAGKFDGAPGGLLVARSRNDPVQWTGNTAAIRHPPWGVNGGLHGAPTQTWHIKSSGERIQLPQTVNVQLAPGDRIISEACGGGGFGDPLDRDPERVRWRAREGWITLQSVHEVYGVVLSTREEQYTVDKAATDALRAELRARRKGERGLRE